MIINKAYKFRLYPTDEQKEQLEQYFGCTRFVFNHFLRRRIDHYAETKKNLSLSEMSRELTALKQHPDYLWLQNVNRSALNYALRHLDTAYTNFFRKQGRFPRFKKKQNAQSFSLQTLYIAINQESSILRVGQIKKIPIIISRTIEGESVSATVSKTATGKYFISISCKVEIPEPEFTGDQVGIDFGVKDFAITSDGTKYSSPKFYQKDLARLKQKQRQLSRKQKGSANRTKARLALSRLHERIANKRNDFLHKLSTKLVCENQAIGLEDLSIQDMLKNKHLAKSISDAGWSEFTRQLAYKSKWYGCDLHFLDRYFPSSKRCHQCGWINESLTLNDRQWDCPSCSTSLDRDVNAAQNILMFSTVGSTVDACGDLVSPSL